MNRLLLLSLVIVVLSVNKVTSRSSGAPEEGDICKDGSPQHRGTYGPQASPSPYKFTAIPIGKTGSYSVKLEAEGDTGYFRGFLIRAIDVAGQFTSGNTLCSGTAVTHSHRENKTEATYTFTPDNLGQKTNFRATALKEYDQYWEGLDA